MDQNKIAVRGSWVVFGRWLLRAANDGRPTTGLFTVQLNNQLLVDRQLNLFTLGQRQHLASKIVAINLQPARRILMAGKLLGLLENRQLAAALADGNFVAHIHLVGGNVDLAAIDVDVAVAHQLARLATRNAKADAMNDSVEAPLQLL